MQPQNASVAVAAADSDLDAFAADYFVRLCDGEQPSLDSYTSKVADPDRRRRLQALLEAGTRATHLFPLALKPGRVLNGRYELREPIARGGMGQVWSAFDHQLERRVAVKVLNPFATLTRSGESVLLRESRLLASLQHPSIVAAHEAGHDGTVQYLVMDFVQGRSIHDVLEDVGRYAGPAPSGADLAQHLQSAGPCGRPDLIESRSWYRSVARIVVELLHALQAAHERGVVHRDLTPRNVLLTAGGHPVLLDFGLAGRLEREAGDLTRGLVGAPPYLAPEQVRDRMTGASVATDVYQAGVLLYELLTRERAFPDASAGELQAIVDGSFRRPRDVDARVPVVLEAVCSKAMRRQPGERYASARAFRADLERFLDGSGVPDAVDDRTWLGVRCRIATEWHRHRVPVLAGAVVVLAVGGAVLASGRTLEVSHARVASHELMARLRVPRTEEVYLLALLGSEQGAATHVLPVRPRVSAVADAAVGVAAARDAGGVDAVRTGEDRTARTARPDGAANEADATDSEPAPWSVRLDAGVHETRAALPEWLPADLRPIQVSAFGSDETGTRQRLEEIWRELDAWVESGRAVPIEDARRIAELARLPTRGGPVNAADRQLTGENLFGVPAWEGASVAKATARVESP